MTRLHVAHHANVEPLLLTPEQAAKALGISRTSLYPLLLDGTITSVMIGRSRRVREPRWSSTSSSCAPKRQTHGTPPDPRRSQPKEQATTIWQLSDQAIEPLDRTSFASERLSERGDLQRLLRDRIEVIDDGLYVLAEEFGTWEDSQRRIDLLCARRHALVSRSWIMPGSSFR